MADAGKINIGTVESNIVINGAEEAKRQVDGLLKSFKQITSGDIPKYWKSQDKLIRQVADSYKNFQQVASKSNAESLYKSIGALQAKSGKIDVGDLVGIDNLNTVIDSIKHSVGDGFASLESLYSSSAFSQIFNDFESIEKEGIDVVNTFNLIKDASSNFEESEENIKKLEATINELETKNKELNSILGNTGDADYIKDLRAQIEDLNKDLNETRENAANTFKQFVESKGLNIIDEYSDRWGNYNSFDIEYFNKIKDGSMTAEAAIASFKENYSHLFDSTASVDFGLNELKNFQTQIDSIASRIEEVYAEIQNIVSQGVMVKAVNSLSTDSSLSDGQRQVFANVSAESESLKTVDAILNAIIEKTLQASDGDREMYAALAQILNVVKEIAGVDLTNLEQLYRVFSALGGLRELEVKPLTNLTNAIQQICGIDDVRNLNTLSNLKLDTFRDLKVSSTLKHLSENLPAIANINVDNLLRLAEVDFKKNFGDLKVDSKALTSLQQFASGIQDAYSKMAQNPVAQQVPFQNPVSLNLQDSDLTILSDIKEHLSEIRRILADLGDGQELSPLMQAFNNINNTLQQISNGTIKASERAIDSLNTKVRELEAELQRATAGDNLFNKVNSGDFGYNSTRIIESLENSFGELENSAKQEIRNILKDTTNVTINEIKSNIANALSEIGKTMQSQGMQSGLFENTISNAVDSGAYIKNISGVNSTAVANDAKSIILNVTQNINTAQEQIDNAITKINSDLSKIKVPASLASEFITVADAIRSLDSQLKNSDISISDYNVAATAIINGLKTQITQVVDSQKKLASIQNGLDSGKFSAQVSSIKKDYQKFNVVSDIVKNNIKELQTAFSEMDKASTDSERIKAEEKYQKVLEKTKNSLKELKNSYASSQDISKLYSQISQWQTKNSKANDEYGSEFEIMINKLKNGVGTLNNGELAQMRTRFEEIKAEANQLGITGTRLVDAIKNRFRSLQVYLASFASFYRIIGYVKEAITIVKDLDTALVDLRKTTTMSKNELDNFYFSSNDVAKQMGVTTQSIIEQGAAWSRLGYSTQEEVERMSKLSSQFASISPGMDTTKAQEGLVSAMKGFGLETTEVQREIMDNVNKIGRQKLPTCTAMCSIKDNYIGQSVMGNIRPR